MALAKHSAERLRVSELIEEATDLARSAVRECWLPILILTAAHAVIFLNHHAAAGDWRPGILSWLAPLGLVFYVPLYGALYRTALGGEDLKTRGIGGLQWSGVEWRLIAVGVVIVFLIGLAATPFLAATGIAALIPASHAPVSIGALGTWSRWAFVVTPIWLVFFWLMAPRLARLMLGWPFSIARGKTEPFAGLGPSSHSGWALAIALSVALLPILVGQLLVYALTLISEDPVMGGSWPLPQAIGAGVLVGVLTAAVQAPLSVGVLAGAWWLLEGDAEAAEVEVDAPLHHSDASTDEAALAAAAALSAQEAAELDLPHEEIDKAAADHAGEHDQDHHSDGSADHPADEHSEMDEAESEVEAPAGDHHEPPLADHDDHEAAARAAEAAAADAHIEEPPVYEPEPEPQPSPPRWGVEPLSPWPHSVLPPWPQRHGFDPPPRRAPLAYEAEPAQPSAETAERP